MQGVKSTYYQISYHQLVWQWYNCIPEIFLDVHRSINSHIVDRMGGLKEITTNRCIITLHPLSLRYFVFSSPWVSEYLSGVIWTMLSNGQTTQTVTSVVKVARLPRFVD